MKWNNDVFKRYMEAGLAVLIVLTLGLAGAAGVLSPRAAESEQTEAAAGDDSTNASQENENKDSVTNPDMAEAQETIADGQYPIMGSSDITVQEMVDYFNASGEEYPAAELSEGGADSIETFCQMYYDEATAEGVRPEVAFAQTMKETGFLQYGGDASIEQFNFAGLGTKFRRSGYDRKRRAWKFLPGCTDRDTGTDTASKSICYIRFPESGVCG